MKVVALSSIYSEHHLKYNKVRNKVLKLKPNQALDVTSEKIPLESIYTWDRPRGFRIGVRHANNRRYIYLRKDSTLRAN